MKDFKIITQDSIPCWYELSWSAKKIALILRVHKDFIKEVGVISSDAPIAEDFIKIFGFSSFVGDFYANFGFDDSFVNQGEKGDFIEYLIKLPRVKVWLDKKCTYCKGTGRNEYKDGACNWCSGEGKIYEFQWKKAFAISASFTVFFTAVAFPEHDTSCKLPQLMTVQTITKTGPHGGSLGGEYSTHMGRFLSSFPPRTSIDEMVKAMQAAYSFMYNDKIGRFDRYEATVAYEKGWLNVSCPGDACGLGPGHASVGMFDGYNFSCHNTDSPMQQLTLLAGLAALQDKARKEIKIYLD